MRFSSCRTQHTQRNGRTACSQKTEIRNSRKTQPISSVAFFVCVHCVYCSSFICIAWPACVASVALRMIAWKPAFKSVFCIPMAVALFQHSAHVCLCQPATGKFLFHDGWAVCAIWRSTLVLDIIIKAYTLNKWAPVSANTYVAGGRADLSQVC